jgi:hypothetical protein
MARLQLNSSYVIASESSIAFVIADWNQDHLAHSYYNST